MQKMVGTRATNFWRMTTVAGEPVDQGPVEPTGYTADSQPLYNVSDEVDGVYGHYCDEEIGKDWPSNMTTNIVPTPEDIPTKNLVSSDNHLFRVF